MAIRRDEAREEVATSKRVAGCKAAATNRMLACAMLPRRVALWARTAAPRRVLPAVALLAVASAVGIATCAAGVGDDESLRRICLGTLGIETFLGLAAVAGALLSQRPVAERLGLGPARLRGGGIALLVLGTLALSFALDGALELTGWSEGTPLAEFERRLARARGANLALALVAVGIAPGVAEELLCRGLVQRGLEPVIGPAWAVVLGAVLFGALHVDPVHAVFAGFLGLYLGAATLVAGSVRTAILCHAVNNLVAVGLGAGWPESPAPGPAGIAVGLAVAAGCIWRARRGAPPGAPASGLQVPAGSDDR